MQIRDSLTNIVTISMLPIPYRYDCTFSELIVSEGEICIQFFIRSLKKMIP